jgi:hypothetical protein
LATYLAGLGRITVEIDFLCALEQMNHWSRERWDGSPRGPPQQWWKSNAEAGGRSKTSSLSLALSTRDSHTRKRELDVRANQIGTNTLCRDLLRMKRLNGGVQEVIRRRE